MTQFSSTLLAWYEKNGRTLPWRTENSPYKVLISEIMLQQTQVSRVIEKFHEFLILFPTIQDLARASKADVIKSWSGLGYNRRALNLHKFAQEVVEQYNGIIPSDSTELIKLPGIGPYASGSIASFAFNKVAPAIDVNVRRVFHRFFDGLDQGLPSGAAQERELYKLVKSTIPLGKSCDFHNALMDFASLVCTRKNPSCINCPLNGSSSSSSCKFAPRYTLHKEKALYVKEKKQEPGIQELGKHIPNRIFRGRIVEWIRNNEGREVTIKDLGSAIKKDFCIDEIGWLLELVEKLEREGMVKSNIKNERIKLILPK